MIRNNATSKKLFAILVVFVIVLSVSISYANSKDIFDHSVFAEHDTYSYDKFEDSWSYNVTYNYHYDEENGDIAIISLIVNNYLDNDAISLAFLAGSMNKNDGPSYNSKSVIFLVDDDRYTITTDGNVMVLLGSKCRPLIEAIANAKEISIKIKLEDADDVIIEGDLEVFEPLVNYCKEVVDSKVMDAFKLSTDLMIDRLFPDAFSH